MNAMCIFATRSALNIVGLPANMHRVATAADHTSH